MNDETPIVVWFRQDLRLSDNPALAAAVAAERPLVLLYVYDESLETDGSWARGGASRWWLDRSLRALRDALQAFESTLIIRRGESLPCLLDVLKASGASAVYWNRRYDRSGIRIDRRVKAELGVDGFEARSFKANLLNEPWEVNTGAGKPYRVFTPYWKSALARDMTRSLAPTPHSIQTARATLESESVDALKLSPTAPNWAADWEQLWQPGERGAWRQWQSFAETHLKNYASARDRPDRSGTSRLSAHLHFGEISPLAIWHEAQAAVDEGYAGEQDASVFLREIGWREFCYNLLYHFPKLPDRNWNSNFDTMAWRDDAQDLKAWQQGRTGFPIVDAGMRELWHTGWMHNRVRMISASFLIKDLGVDWRLGEKWFWDTLVDADLANNAGGWQWVAGSGADAAPYFRVFNPTTQAKKFDPDGVYIRRWIPELAALPTRYLHEPTAAPAAVLTEARVRLGADYPRPMVDHKAARESALDAYKTMREYSG